MTWKASIVTSKASIVTSKASFLTLLLSLVIEAPGRVTSANTACPDWSIPSGLKEWSANPAGDNVEIVWRFDKVCANVSQCFGNISTSSSSSSSFSSVNFITFSQLPPVQIRPDQTISFRVDTGGDQSVQLEYFDVDGNGFQNCSLNTNQLIIINDDTRLGVANGTLVIGNNYFIANNSSQKASPWQCYPYGLRVNVTVQPRDCSQMEPNAGLLCVGRGICAARIYEPSYTCHCCPGYMGDYCELIDGCYGKKCQQGTCIDGPDNNIDPSFTCNCIPGFTGVYCETIDGIPCPTNECMNRGVCVTSDASILNFRCICTLGFTGKVCETNIDECASNPCINSPCHDGINSYQCMCTADFTGTNCEAYIGPCPPNRCFNGGECIPQGGDSPNATCECTFGFTGYSCETKIEICHSNFCIHAVDCIEYGTEFQCVCNPGYTGEICDVNVDECLSNPCLNGGTCQDHVAFFTCDCPANLTPPICDNSLEIAKEKLDNKTEAAIGLTIALAVIGSLVGLALIILLIYCCSVHKPYKQLRLQKKYVHVVDENFDSDKTSLNPIFVQSSNWGLTNKGLTTEGDDIAMGSHPSSDFQADAIPDAEVTTPSHSAKSPLVRRVKHSEQSRV